jgi:hypothetical protein
MMLPDSQVIVERWLSVVYKLLGPLEVVSYLRYVLEVNGLLCLSFVLPIRDVNCCGEKQ